MKGPFKCRFNWDDENPSGRKVNIVKAVMNLKGLTSAKEARRTLSLTGLLATSERGCNALKLRFKCSLISVWSVLLIPIVHCLVIFTGMEVVQLISEVHKGKLRRES